MANNPSIPFGTPFVLIDREHPVRWYRVLPNGPWHIYKESQFYYWRKMTPNKNATGKEYNYTMLRKNHIMLCNHVYRDDGEFKLIDPQSVMARHPTLRFCKACRKRALKEIKASGFYAAKKEEGKRMCARRWGVYHKEKDQENWYNK